MNLKNIYKGIITSIKNITNKEIINKTEKEGYKIVEEMKAEGYNIIFGIDEEIVFFEKKYHGKYEDTLKLILFKTEDQEDDEWQWKYWIRRKNSTL